MITPFIKLQQFVRTQKITLIVVGLTLAAAALGVSMLTKPQDPRSNASPATTLTVKKWHPITLDFTGPTLSESQNNPNPFLDYRLNVTFISPSGMITVVPGFFDGDGAGGATGNVWRVRFSPDEVGTWNYSASFRTGTEVAIDLNPNAGTATSFNDASGTFAATDRDHTAPGFLKYGRLEYTNNHYLKFRDGGYFIKGGTDSPENFLGFKGFDNTLDQGNLGIIHEYGPHRSDWASGDPLFTSQTTGVDSKGIIGALNYLSSQHVNSIYFLPMNLGGDGQETYPFISPQNTHDAKVHYDLSKLSQWNHVFDHATKKGVLLHVVLGETEVDNRNWLDNGTLGVERKLYYRELIARFGHQLAIKWNISEENVFSASLVGQMAQYINDLDPYDHPVTAHTPMNQISMYDPLFTNPNLSATAVQYEPDHADDFVESLRGSSTNAGRPWVIDFDENGIYFDADNLRKKALYDILFSGGNVEWYLGHSGEDQGLEDFRSRETLWKYTWYARKFIEENLPFWEMVPNDELVTGESSAGTAQVFTKAGEIYAIYLVGANPSGNLNLTDTTGSFTKQWYNPRSGNFEGTTTTMNGGSSIPLGSPPSSSDQDWVVLIKRPGYTPPPPTPPPAQVSAYYEQSGLVVVQAESPERGEGWVTGTNVAGYTGDSFIRWDGPDYFNTPGNGLIDYKLFIQTPGTYQIRLRSYKDDPDPSQNNDVWVKVDNDDWLKTFSAAPINDWFWNTQYDLIPHVDQPPASAELSTGLHTLSLSGRSNDFHLDRLHLYLDSHPNPLDLTHPESPYQSISNPPPFEQASCQAVSGSLSATSVTASKLLDFTVTTSGSNLTNIELCFHGNFAGPGWSTGWQCLRDEDPTTPTYGRYPHPETAPPPGSHNPPRSDFSVNTDGTFTFTQIKNALVTTGHNAQSLDEHGIKWAVNVYQNEGVCFSSGTYSTGGSCTAADTCEGTLALQSSSNSLPGDINGDGAVNGGDYVIIYSNWGLTPPTDPRADINGDGIVNGGDYVVVFSNWGTGN